MVSHFTGFVCYCFKRLPGNVSKDCGCLCGRNIFQLLLRDKALETLRKERDELRARMEDRATQWVKISHTNKKLEADLAARRDKMHSLHLEVRLLFHFLAKAEAKGLT